MNEKLSLCPFCGCEAEIIICDDEGNLHDEEYEKDPWSGLRYMIFHNAEKAEDCPVSHIEIENSIWMYDTREEAVEAWNTRVEQKDFISKVYDWAFSSLEGCDEPEWSLFFNIADAISNYRKNIKLSKGQS